MANPNIDFLHACPTPFQSNLTFPWPWSNTSQTEHCNVIPALTQNELDDMVGYIEIVMGVAILLMMFFYLLLCCVKACTGTNPTPTRLQPRRRGYDHMVRCCREIWGCGCAKHGNECCRSSATSLGCEMLALFLAMVCVAFWVLLFSPAFWNGTWECGFWHWYFLDAIFNTLTSIFSFVLLVWMYVELRNEKLIQRRRRQIGKSRHEREHQELAMSHNARNASTYLMIEIDEKDDEDFHKLNTTEKSSLLDGTVVDFSQSLEDLKGWASLTSLGEFIVILAHAAIVAGGMINHDCWEARTAGLFTEFTFDDPCQTLDVGGIVVDFLSAMCLFAMGRRCLVNTALPNRLRSHGMAVLAFGVCMFFRVIIDAAVFALNHEWDFYPEALTTMVLLAAPMMYMAMRTFLKCKTPAVSSRHKCCRSEKQRQRGKQCCQCLRHATVPLLVIVLISIILAAASGIGPCTNTAERTVFDVNYSAANNFTATEQQFGAGIYFARFGAGPLGFLVFILSVSMYFGVIASLEKTFMSSILPRVTGSPTALHSMIALVMWVFLIAHIVGHLMAKTAFLSFTDVELSHIGPHLDEFFSEFRTLWPWSYISGIVATVLMLVLTIGGLVPMCRAGLFPCCCCVHCSSDARCCNIYNNSFRLVHRVSAALVLVVLAFHSVEANLGGFVLWIWMAILALFFIAEYVGFQGWCVCRCCSRPRTLWLCSMKQQVSIMSVEHERARGKMKPAVFIRFTCHVPGAFLPTVGEYCFFGISGRTDKKKSKNANFDDLAVMSSRETGFQTCSRLMAGTAFHPFTVFSLKNPNEFGLYLHTGLDEKIDDCSLERGGWCYDNFVADMPHRFTDEAVYREEARKMKRVLNTTKDLYVIGGFGSELAEPAFLKSQKIFNTCAGAGVTPFLAIAADFYKKPGKYAGKVITTVRSASHPMIPEYLRTEFGFTDIQLPTDVTPNAADSEEVAAHKQLAGVKEALGGRLTCLILKKGSGVYRFIQGYINVNTVLRGLSKKSDKEVDRVLRQVYVRDGHDAFSRGVFVHRPLLLVQGDLDALFKGQDDIDPRAVLKEIEEGRTEVMEMELEKMFDGPPQLFDSWFRSLPYEVLVTEMDLKSLNPNASVAPRDVLKQIQGRPENEVEAQLRSFAANRARFDAFWDSIPRRKPLCVEDLTAKFGSGATGEVNIDALLANIERAQRIRVVDILSQHWGRDPDEGDAAIIDMLDNKVNRPLLADHLTQDELRPVAKLAKIFATKQNAMGVSFGHCGNGDKIEFYCTTYQEHIRANGHLYIESFD